MSHEHEHHDDHEHGHDHNHEHGHDHPHHHHVEKPVIAIDGRYGLRSPRRGVGEYVYRLVTELGFISRPYELHVFGDLSADPEVLSRMRFLHPVDLLITPNFFTWEQMAFPQATHGAAFIHGTANINPLATRTPQILTVHDAIEWHRGKDFPGAIPFRHHVSRLYRMNALKRLAPKAQAILTVSDHAKEDIHQILHVDRERIVVTPLAAKNPITAPQFPKEKYFLTLGAMDPRKNLMGAIQAFKRFDRPDYSLKVVGVEPGALRSVKEQVHQWGLDGRVEVQGMVSDEELNGLYQKATGFLYLSFFEGFGLPVLEAMAAGCPVIASKTSSIPEVVGEGGLLVNPSDANEVSKAMQKIADDPDLQAQLVSAGQAHAEDYSWKRTAQLTNETYIQLLQSRHLI